jgi:hypothetical protein
MNRLRDDFRGLVVLFCLAFLLTAIAPANAGPTPEQIHERAGQGIIFGIKRIFQVISGAGGGDFAIALASHEFSAGNTRLRLDIQGQLNALGWTTRTWLVKHFSNEMPLPQRPECRGFLKLQLPDNAANQPNNALIPIGFTATLEVKVDECIRMIGLAIVGTGLSQANVFQSDAFLTILQRIPPAHVNYVLKKFFPKLFMFLGKRSAKLFFDEILLDGQVTGTRIMTHLSMEEFTGFAVNFGLGLARNAAIGTVQGAVGVGVGAAVCSLPFFGNVALGAVLVAITGKAADSLISFGMNAFEAGLFRDRFAKIEGWLLGTYSPGVNQADWLEEQVGAEAKRDDYSSLRRLVIHIQRVPPLKRGFWLPYVNKLRVPVEFKARQDNSWIAQKYLGILEVLFAS